MKTTILRGIAIVTTFLIASLSTSAQVRSLGKTALPDSTIVKMLMGSLLKVDRAVEVQSVVLDGNTVRIRMSEGTKQIPLTTHDLDMLTDSVRHWLSMPNIKVSLVTRDTNLSSIALTDNGWCGVPASGSPIRRTDEGFAGSLTGRNLALWPSHGRYYESKLNRWEWQRARLFTTVEDVFTPSFVLPFLIPMLENAGCSVFTPRERDTTRVVCIVDDADGMPAFTPPGDADMQLMGFGRYDILKGYENPFQMGSAAAYKLTANDSIVFRGKAPADGHMMVYLAYASLPSLCKNVSVAVSHAGGIAHYEVNQQMGGGMWMPLGKLPFHAGQEWLVVLKGDGMVSADAVRIGGGMGTVSRGGQLSGLPSWAEAAKYYMQTDGFDQATVYAIGDEDNDYTNDVNGRGEWVNSLVKDKHIPIDASFALHTDAGVTYCDSTIGTLTLITTKVGKTTTYPDGRKRQTSRQFAGLVQQSIVNDIRKSWCHDWMCRGIADKGYSESRRPEVPAVLLELLSHQNIADMRMGLHPAFRRDISRSIYKGILRYLAGPQAPVTPLPPSCFGIKRETSNSVRLSWVATTDTLEPSAVATKFLIYCNDRLVGSTSDTTIIIPHPTDGLVRDYHIVAVGQGGRSLPSEVLSASLWGEGSKFALLVEGCDRLSAPAMVLSPTWSGVVPNIDGGVAWDGDIYTTGDQHDYDPNHDWEDDDAPGCGASYADREMVGVAGNGARRGSSASRMMAKAGYSFVSQSKDYFDRETNDKSQYDLIRIVLGRQRTTSYGDMIPQHSIYTIGFRQRVGDAAQSGVRIVISGAFVGSDISDEETKAWCRNVLGFKPRTGHASRNLKLTIGDDWLQSNLIERPDVNNLWHWSVDAIEPAQGAQTVFRYADTQMSGAVQKGNIIVVGM